MKLEKDDRKSAVDSLMQYAERELPEPLGEFAAGHLLDFFLQEVGPLIYNKAIGDAQTRLQLRLAELDGDLYEEPFTYWSKKGTRSR